MAKDEKPTSPAGQDFAKAIEAARKAAPNAAEALKNLQASGLGALFDPDLKMERAIATATEAMRTETERLEQSLSNSDRKAGDILGRLQTLADRASNIEKSISNPEAELAAFKAAVKEDLKLNDARALWANSAHKARLSYAMSWLVLVILLIAAPAVAIWQSGAIFTFFRAVGEAVLVDLPENASETAILIAAVSRLVLITLPVALYIWLIRIIVRFNMRSLLLMDDANQRNTMLETYLHLVEQDAGVKVDRPLILEALFRRTPGHGPETIEPPNLADVMKLGSKPSVGG